MMAVSDGIATDSESDGGTISGSAACWGCAGGVVGGGGSTRVDASSDFERLCSSVTATSLTVSVKDETSFGV